MTIGWRGSYACWLSFRTNGNGNGLLCDDLDLRERGTECLVDGLSQQPLDAINCQICAIHGYTVIHQVSEDPPAA